MPKFDVALSFLGQDEPLAVQLAVELKGRAEVFLYSERQKELAGKDGLEAFARVFREDSLTCVAFYREGWGATDWTRVEETALKDRGLTQGWDFLLLISLDGKSPVWTPRTQIWLDWQRFGLQAAVPVVERKITEAGGDLRAVGAIDRAAAIGQALQRQADTKAFLGTQAAVELARVELTTLFGELERMAGEISAKNAQFRFTISRERRNDVIAVGTAGLTTTFGWSQQWSNSPDQSGLFVRHWLGPYAVGHHIHIRGEPVIDAEYYVNFTLDSAGLPAWRRDTEPDRLYTSLALADFYMKLIVEHAHDKPRYDEGSP